MKNEVSAEQFYDQFAPSYDAELAGTKIDAQHVNEVATLFNKKYRDENGNILDIGCGTGRLKDLLDGQFNYTGIDVSGKMLEQAAQRGYEIIHSPVEAAITDLGDNAFDFVFALSSLLFVEDIQSVLVNMRRIARRAIFLSLDNLSEEYIRDFAVSVFDHAGVAIADAKDGYLIRGWTSPTTGITIQTRIIHVPLT